MASSRPSERRPPRSANQFTVAGGMVIEVQEPLRVELKRPLRHIHELRKERDHFVASLEVSRVIFLSGFVVADLSREQRRDRIPVAARASLVELPDGSFLYVDSGILRAAARDGVRDDARPAPRWPESSRSSTFHA